MNNFFVKHFFDMIFPTSYSIFDAVRLISHEIKQSTFNQFSTTVDIRRFSKRREFTELGMKQQALSVGIINSYITTKGITIFQLTIYDKSTIRGTTYKPYIYNCYEKKRISRGDISRILSYEWYPSRKRESGRSTNGTSVILAERKIRT